MTRARDVANLIGSGNFSSTTFTATAGQTAFTISHTQGFIQVFMNGLLLDETVDYTSNGSAVTLTSGAAAGDEIEVVAYNTFSVGDALNQAAADTRYVNTTGDTMTGALTGTSAGFTGDVNIGNNDASNPVSKLRLGATLYGAADIVPVSTGHKIGLDFKTDSTGDTTIDPVTRMSISNEGYITTPFQPAILASSSTIQTFASTATNTTMVLGTTNFSRGNLTRSGNALTVPVTGYYVFHYAIAANIYSSIRAFGVRLFKNDSQTQAHNYHSAHYIGGSSATHDEFTGTFLISLAANDYVSLVGALYDTNSNINFQTQINGYLIG